jgi:primosomal protein N'
LFTKSGLKKYEINEHSIRKQFNYPPFSDLVLLSKKINKNEDENLEKLKKTLEEKKINFYVYPNQTVSKKGIYQSILIKTDIHTKEWEYVVKDIPQDWSVNVHPHTI